MTDQPDDFPLEITDEDRAEAARSAHTPDLAEIRELLVRYFVGPITEDHVMRLADRFACEHESHWRADRRAFDSPTAWRGWAWNEEVCGNRRSMAPVDHLLFMGHSLWMRDDSDRRSMHWRGGHEPPTGWFPQPKRYCPAYAAGTWEQLEPSHGKGERPTWQMDLDAAFRTDSPDVSTKEGYWCVLRSYASRVPRFGLVIGTEVDRAQAGWTLYGTVATKTELAGTYIGYMTEVPFRLRRCKDRR